MSVEAIGVRLEEHGRRIGEIERTQPAVTASQVRELGQDIIELREEMRALKRALYSLAISITGGAVLFAFTAFQIWGSSP